MSDTFIVGGGHRGRRAVFTDVCRQQLLELNRDPRRQIGDQPHTVAECGDMIGQDLKAGIHIPRGMQDCFVLFFDFGIGVNPFVRGENLIGHDVLRYSCK